ncbi:CheY-like chemotaxis protein/CHASE3 domain sensor protein [Pseudomonas sp. BIGb0408]|uniref:histidine kinase n=1 Tax=Phytopseudomonas flavescens TaxID=29435 RepID=A0A7Y9XRM3_9GAMM|nr:MULTISPECIES: response regulator [Pseudomonas]MCW2290458.1 CheY-like chemotaxis protein/CHASE3 domain sensor protein [Pseudomonas sp. BIGb0408]NYH74969.1 CheY-like chemotaxis protein/CHASE3 domain sensor protein [Pseudomonas flavescens]
MTNTSSIDENSFKRILRRNVALPLGVGVVSAIFFVVLIGYLLNVLGWVQHTDRVLNNANEGLKLSIDQETGFRGYLLSGDVRFLQPFEVAKPRIKAEMEILSELVSDNPVQVDRLRAIAALQDEWSNFAQTAITAKREGGNFIDPVRDGRGKQLTDAIRAEYADFVAHEQRLRKERNDAASSTATVTIVLFLLFTLLFSGSLALFGRRELLSLTNTYGAILKKQDEHNERLQAQAWLRNGQTDMSERLIGQQALPVLGRNMLEFLASHLGAAVGALYVREEHGGLRRVASYGFSREQEKAEQSFYSTEGLVGQVAQSRRLLTLDHLPADYLKVSSGLGQGEPLTVALLPIDNDGEVNGVIELGFLRTLSERDGEFLKQIASSIGASVEAARYRHRLQEILAETQQLNEELQVQQEELKTANEELEEQSRALKESQAHLETQQAELEQTNEQLSSQRDALDDRNSALRVAQQQLEERAEELQRASRYKSEFLANMSHELRTPLNSSLILAKLLSDNPKGNLDAEQVKFADSIYSAGNDLLNLINDILDISKVEAGKLDLRPENANVVRLAESLEGTFQPLAGEKHLGFNVQVGEDVPRSLYTDRLRVEQILKNLLSNAIKFTEQGSVSLTVSRVDEGVAFAVRDSGIGIQADQQEYIFEAFRQADGTTNRRFGGTGLGLSISRDLAVLLGGSISVSSVLGEGSVFTLVLPQSYSPLEADTDELPAAPVVFSRSHAPRAPEPVKPVKDVVVENAVPTFLDDRGMSVLGGRSVLVIEDEPQFAHILYDLAHELDYRCLVAHCAEDGLDLATTHHPDAILLDMRLPDVSGLSVLQRLKENPGTRHIPVHVISVEDMAEAALQMGAVGYALKPATRDQLKGVFSKLEARLTQKMKRVLVVEDDKLQRDSIARLIGDDDIEIVAVEFGEQALEQLRHHIFDCMIIDLKLPDMQGDELLARMGSEHIRSFPPVIVYTGRNLTRAEEAELLKYSRSIIIKGARSPERLLDEVTLFLHMVESELSSERQTMLKTARSRDRVFEGRRILVVDDDVRNIFALTSALEQKGAQVEVARNGREAIDKLEAVSDIDLVLMDVMMPEMDGYEATRRIRENPRWRKLPIISVTAKAMKDDQDLCMKAGANDYLAKPIDLDRLFSLIRVWLPKLERI